MQCPSCPASLSVLEIAEHIQRIHIRKGLGLWRCGDCPFDSDSLNDALTHCLAEDHNPLTLRCVSPEMLLSLTRRAQELKAIPSDFPKPTLHDYPRPLYSEATQFPLVQLEPIVIAATNGPTPFSRYATPITPKNSRKRARKYSSSRKSQERLRATSPTYSNTHDADVMPFVGTSSIAPLSKDEEPIEPSEQHHTNFPTEYILSDPDTEEDKEMNPASPNRMAQDSLEAESEEGNRTETHICELCHKPVKFDSATEQMKIRHVISCLKLKPFACEACNFASSRKDKMRIHINKHHADSDSSVNIIYPRKVRDEMAVRKGMLDCFPNINSSAWNGF